MRVPVQFGVQGLLTAERERFGIQLNSKVDRIPIWFDASLGTRVRLQFEFEFSSSSVRNSILVD